MSKVRMFSQFLLPLLLLYGLLTGTVYAGTVVLIHGFQGQGMDWRKQGVTPVLQASGWADAGHYSWDRNGIRSWINQSARAPQVFFTVDLPGSAAIGTQARVLNDYLQAIYQVRNEPIMLVGHSAGGVVARYWLVTYNTLPMNTLMTIAAPHLGTPLANAADLLNTTPLARMANVAGVSALKEARHLARDLREEASGNFVYWLNRQQHPAIRYVSVIRDSERPDNADFVVPPHRQNMNNVLALRGQSYAIRSQRDHFLSVEDGYRIASVALTLPTHAP